MPHSICAVGRRTPATGRVPHDERLILKVLTKLYFWDKLPDNRGGVDLPGDFRTS